MVQEFMTQSFLARVGEDIVTGAYVIWLFLSGQL